MKEIYITTIDEEFEKAQVKGFSRTRKGKMERVNPFERKGEKRETWKKEGRSYRKNPKTGRVQVMTFTGWKNTTETKTEKEGHAGKLAKRSGKERQARQLAHEAGYTYSMGRLKNKSSGKIERMSIGEVIEKFSEKGGK